MARKTLAEYEATRKTTVVGLRMSVEDAEMLERRAANAGAGKAEYVVALMRSRSIPEHDVRLVAGLAAATATVSSLKAELVRTRSALAEGFGLLKNAFISHPADARRSKVAIDEACAVAKAVIRESERVIDRVAAASVGPLDDLREAVDAIRTGRL